MAGSMITISIIHLSGKYKNVPQLNSQEVCDDVTGHPSLVRHRRIRHHTFHYEVREGEDAAPADIVPRILAVLRPYRG
jgi:hypothetical protein